MSDERPEPQPQDVQLTVAEVARELRVNPATVRLWISKGTLSAQRVGERKLFHREIGVGPDARAVGPLERSPKPRSPLGRGSEEDRPLVGW